MRNVFHVTDLPLSLSPSQVLSVYPTQLLEVLLAFIMFIVLWRMRDHDHAEGWLFGVWCIFAGAERFVVEFFRAKDDRYAWAAGLSMAQVIAIAIIAIGVAIMAARSKVTADKPGILATA
jgi:phosphatidylglycerol:prolipoprotein diacylglycerol transferase